MAFIKKKALSSSLSDGLKDGVNSLWKNSSKISFNGLKMQFLLSETSSVSLKMKQNDSHIHKDIQTD